MKWRKIYVPNFVLYINEQSTRSYCFKGNPYAFISWSIFSQVTRRAVAVCSYEERKCLGLSNARTSTPLILELTPHLLLSDEELEIYMNNVDIEFQMLLRILNSS